MREFPFPAHHRPSRPRRPNGYCIPLTKGKSDGKETANDKGGRWEAGRSIKTKEGRERIIFQDLMMAAPRVDKDYVNQKNAVRWPVGKNEGYLSSFSDQQGHAGEEWAREVEGGRGGWRKCWRFKKEAKWWYRRCVVGIYISFSSHLLWECLVLSTLKFTTWFLFSNMWTASFESCIRNTSILFVSSCASDTIRNWRFTY